MSAETIILESYNRDFRQSNKQLRERIVELEKEIAALKKKLLKKAKI